MTEQEAILLLSQMYFPFLEQREKDAITKAIEALQAIEAWNTRVDADIRAKAIDEFAEKIKEHMQIVGTTYLEDIFEIAEQMKGGVSE